MSGDASKGQQVDITQLPLPQLQQIKQQLDTELSHLTSSHTQLRAAQSKFKDCITTIRTSYPSSPTPQAKQILVPLTTSLYVPATLAPEPKVLVDVGTGFYVEKEAEEAVAFYTGKVGEIGESVKGLEEVLGQKRGNVRVVEEVLRGRMLRGEGSNGSAKG